MTRASLAGLRDDPRVRVGGTGLVVLALGTLVGSARMAVGVHLPLDVVGGLGLGAAAAALAVFFALR